MSKVIFISCVYEDRHRIDSIINWANNDRLGNVIITYETEDKRFQGKIAIKNYIKEKIKKCSVVFVLIGRDTHNHDWISSEVELANNFNKKIICIRVPNTNSPPPTILAKYKIINFDPDSIYKVL